MMNTLVDTLAAVGREYARDIVTVLIYATPQRGGYRRTRTLIRSIYADVEYARRRRPARVQIGASAHYAIYNEMGTHDGYLGEDTPEEILADARAAQSDLITLEYGQPEKGLEPRPFIIPALVMLEREAPQLILRAYRRMARG